MAHSASQPRTTVYEYIGLSVDGDVVAVSQVWFAGLQVMTGKSNRLLEISLKFASRRGSVARSCDQAVHSPKQYHAHNTGNVVGM